MNTSQLASTAAVRRDVAASPQALLAGEPHPAWYPSRLQPPPHPGRWRTETVRNFKVHSEPFPGCELTRGVLEHSRGAAKQRGLLPHLSGGSELTHPPPTPALGGNSSRATCSRSLGTRMRENSLRMTQKSVCSGQSVKCQRFQRWVFQACCASLGWRSSAVNFQRTRQKLQGETPPDRTLWVTRAVSCSFH